MTEPIKLPPLAGTLAAMPPHHQKVIKAYGEACARVAIEADRKASEPVAWLSKCIQGLNSGKCVIAKEGKPTINTTYWSQPFPVYTAPQPQQQARQCECQRKSKAVIESEREL